ncbi:MAG: NADH-quinone oxidoreductase subunit C [Chitinophagaceae bacterium]|nr:NADH-quinone oxidoreductase subunit C [Chitinophagaceae bacterium]
MSNIDAGLIIQKLTTQFGDAVTAPDEPYGLLTMNCSCDKIIPVLEFLHNDETLAFTFLTDLCGVHYPHRSAKFEVVYHLHSFTNNIRLRIKVAITGDPPHIPSATAVFESANWMERETYDFYGILFDGHPNLKRILNVDEMTIFPMRKEYPLEDNTRRDKNDEMFGRDPKLILNDN